MTDSSTLTVGLDDRAYDITVGRDLIGHVDEIAGAQLADRHAVIIADAAVAPHHLAPLEAACERVCRRVDSVTVASGEASKSMAVLASLLEDILAIGVDRDVVLVALGGGVIGDLAGFAAAALFATLSGSRNPAQLPSVLISKPAPATPVPLLDNAAATLDLAAFAGQPLLVNFFASWCAPCRAEAPALALLAETLPVIGIAYKDKPADTQAFLTQYGNPFSAIGVDRDGRLGFAWGV